MATKKTMGCQHVFCEARVKNPTKTYRDNHAKTTHEKASHNGCPDNCDKCLEYQITKKVGLKCPNCTRILKNKESLDYHLRVTCDKEGKQDDDEVEIDNNEALVFERSQMQRHLMSLSQKQREDWFKVLPALRSSDYSFIKTNHEMIQLFEEKMHLYNIVEKKGENRSKGCFVNLYELIKFIIINNGFKVDVNPLIICSTFNFGPPITATNTTTTKTTN
ncbi:hypothetical protein ACTFIZ_007197 [Dictyostelium cf. discoideum]